MSDDELSHIHTLKIFCEKYTSFPMAGMRHYIFYEKSNGLKESGAILRIGKIIHVDSQKFLDWIRSIQK